ncbi:GDSL-like lipase/acylhydrolase family protein [Mycoplasmopsis mustelae]|uniref:GDSL-like lipase/acylhydrolase family protein n=1 Tax=Mycoplasmopsis mustelae TaxID=171289 RepID=A0A4R7UCU2_9BACT|nr:SGNH/GDSL hydrolase family protein [Mycoplasmopsis mustelae]TDV24272.1 GDSL-like lipase/acylhydrolase family protein [Mycoplasmopsis mustelae]
MKKSKFVFSSGLAILTAASITAACGSPKPTNNSENPKNTLPEKKLGGRVKSEHFIPVNQKIRYVAIGDSITEGFDGTLLKSYPGKKEADGTIKGISYPAYLARLLNQNNRVEDFENFAVSGSRILDWLRLLNIPYKSAIEYENHQETTIFSQRQKEDKNFVEKVKTKLKDANLVTFSLSANDMFYLFFQSGSKDELITIVKKYFTKQAIATDVASFFDKLLQDVLRETQKRLLTFISNIKQLAPKANINIISYPTPMFGIVNVLRDYINKLLDGNFNVSPFDFLVNQLNDGLHQVAKRTGINFIQGVNADYWNHNVTKLNSLFLDIHPNIFGYKKLAMDIYLKLTNQSLKVADYKNYDFSQKFLDVDADSAKYEIEVSEPATEILGASTDAYLNTRTDEESIIAAERNVNNFDDRIVDLAKGFLVGFKVNFSFLTTNTVYNLLDPDHLLINLLNTKLDSGKYGKDSIIDVLLNAKIINNIIEKAESHLNNLWDRKELTLDKVSTVLKDAVFNDENLALLISSIAQSELVAQHKDELAVALKTIFKNVLVVFKDKINETIINYFSDIFEKYNLAKSDLLELSNAVLTSQNLSNLINLLVDSFILKPQNFKNVKNLQDIMNALFKDDATNQKIITNIHQLFISILVNPKLKKITSQLIYNFLKESKLDKNISNTQVESIVGDSLNLIQDINNEFKVFDDITLGVLTHLKTINDFKLPAIFNSILNQVYNKFFNTGDSTTLFYIVKKIVQSNLFTRHKDFAKQIVKNVLDAQNLSLISERLGLFITSTESISQYISKDGLRKLIELIFKQPEILQLLESTIDAVIDNSSLWDSVNNFNDLILEVLKRIPYDESKPQIKQVFARIINDATFTEVLKEFLNTTLNSFGLDIRNEANAKFINDLVTYISAWLTESNFSDEIIDIIGDVLNIAKNSSVPLNELAKISTKISNALNDKLSNFTVGEFKEFIQQPWITENINAAALTIKVIIKGLVKRGTLKISSINNWLTSNTTAKYVDATEVTPLIQNILQTDLGIELVEKTVRLLLLNPNLLDKLNEPRGLLNILFANADFKAILTNYLKPLLLPEIQAKHLPKTVAKLIIEFSKRHNYQIQDNYLPLLESLYPSLVDLLDQMHNFPEVIDAIIKGITTSNNVDEIARNIFKEIAQVVNFGDYGFWKKVFATDFISQHKAELKTLLLQLFNTLKPKIFPNVLEAALPENLHNANKAQLKELITTILTNNEFNALLEALLGFILDHNKQFANANTFTDALNLVLKDAEFINTNKTHIITLLNTLKNNAIFINLLKSLAIAKLDSSSFSYLFEGITNKTELINNIIDFIITQFDGLKVFETFVTMLQTYATTESNDLNKLSTLFTNGILSDLFAKLYQSTDFKTLLGKVFVKQINKTEYANIFNEISSEKRDKAGELVVDAFGVIDQTLHLSSVFIDEIIKQLSSQESNFDINVVLNKWVELIKQFAASPDFEEKLLKLLNSILALPDLADQTNKEVFIKLVENSVGALITNVDFGSILWNIFGNSLQNLTSKNSITQQQFTTVINAALKAGRLKDVLVKILKYYINNKDTFAHSKSILDIIKKYLEVDENKTEFKNAIKSVFTTAFARPEFKNAIKTIVDDVFAYLNLTKTEDIQSFITAITDDFGGLLDRIGVFDSILNVLVDAVKNSSDLASFVTYLNTNAKTSLNLFQFNLFKKVLNDQVITQHKSGVKALLQGLVTNLLNDEQKIKDFLDRINLNGLLLGATSLSDPEFINDSLVSVFKNQNIRDLINLIFADLVDRADVYNQNNDWLSAINTLFKSENAPQFKTKFLAWLKDTLSNPDQKLSRGLAQLLLVKLNDAGFALTEQDDLTLLSDILEKLLKTLAKRPELDNMINHIYDNIRGIDFSKNSDPNQIKRAILDGTLYMILTDDKKNISLSKLVGQKDLAKSLIDSIGDNNFITFINRLFETSNRVNKMGIYAFIDNFTKAPDSNTQQKSNNSNDSYGVDSNGIISFADGMSQLFSVILEPAFRNMILKQSKNEQDYVTNHKNTPEYKFLFRLSTLILWWIHDGAGVTGIKYWNSSGYDVQGYYNQGLRYAYAKAKEYYKDQFNSLTSQQKFAIGAKSTTDDTQYNDEYIIGKKSTGWFGANNNSATYYDQNLILAYIYYNNRGQQKDYHTNKTMKEVLIEAIETGYLGDKPK